MNLILGIFLVWKFPQLLNKIIYCSLLIFWVLMFGEVLLGIFLTFNSVFWKGHYLLAHGVSILLWLILGFSLPACVGHCIRTKNFFGFREIPSGILVMILLMFCTFTGYLNPRFPRDPDMAFVRFKVIHYYLSNIFFFVALYRWSFLMKRNRNISYNPLRNH